MNRITTSIFLLIAFVLFTPVALSSGQEVDWEPTIYANGQSYITTFQHSSSALKYYTSVEEVDVDGKMMNATVVRFAPNVLNADPPATDAMPGVEVNENEYNFSQTIDLTGQPDGGIIVIEIFEMDIDVNDPESIANPKGKGTLVGTGPAGG
jgi:hypothetical protein